MLVGALPQEIWQYSVWGWHMENVGKPLPRLYMITHQKEDSAVSVKLKDFQLRELKYNFVEKIVHRFHK